MPILSKTAYMYHVMEADGAILNTGRTPTCIYMECMINSIYDLCTGLDILHCLLKINYTLRRSIF